MTSSVTGSSAAVIGLLCWRRLQYDNLGELLIIYLLGVGDLAVLGLSPGEEATSRSSKFIVSSNCGKLVTLFFGNLLFCKVSFKIR